MTPLVIFLEEPSARAMLQGLLPRILPETVAVQYIVFEGKSDLEKKLPKRLRAWQAPDAKFLVLRDQDSGDCRVIKDGLVQKCHDAAKPDVVVRIACRELESFYLGDLAAVADAIGPNAVRHKQQQRKFRTPDRLGSPSRELKQLAPSYQKIAGSRAIGPQLNIEANHSRSFQVLIEGIRELVES